MQPKINILLVEDSKLDAELIVRELQKEKINFEVTVVDSKLKFTKAISEEHFDIILSDHTLPFFDSYEVLRLLKDAGISIPFILITATMSDEFAVNIMKQGADDYIIKDRLKRLPSAVISLVDNHRIKLSREAVTHRLAFHIENSPLGFIEWSGEGEVTTFSTRAAQIFDWPEKPGSVAARNLFETIFKDDLPLLRQTVQELVNGVVAGNTIQVRCAANNGILIWCDFFNSVLRDRDNSVITIMSLVNDITEGKRAEQKLVETTASFHQVLNDLQKIMNSSLDIICSIDAEGRFASVSAASQAIWGYRPDELIGRQYLDLVFEPDIEITMDVAGQVMAGTTFTMFENRYVHKNGMVVPLLWSARWDDTDKLMYCIAKDATEKKRMENAFQSERQRFYDMYLQAPSSMVILRGPSHIFDMANPLYLEIVGKKDVIGKTVREVLPEIVEQGFLDILDEVYYTGVPFLGKEMMVKIDREGKGDLTNIYLNFIYQAYRNSNGEIEGIFFFGNEVTEQVLSRKKIEESENRYRQIVETAQEGIWMIDKDRKTVFVNKKMCEILEYSADEMLGKENTFFMDQEGLKIASDADSAGIVAGSEKMDISLITSKGKKIWVALSGKVILDAAGVFNGGLSMVTDITERKKNDEEIKGLANRLQMATLSAGMGIWDWNLIDNTLNWDEGMRELYQLDDRKCESTYIAWMSMLHPGDIKRVENDLDKILKNEKEGDSEFRIIWADLSEHYIRGSSRIERDQNGNPVRMIGANWDITESKLAEIERLKITRDLIRQNKDLEQFTYIVSHNLRAPVANILGLLNILNHDAVDAATKDVITRNLEISVKGMDTVLKDLNQILQVKGEIQEKKELIIFSELVDSIQLSLHNLISRDHIHVEYDFSAIDAMTTVKSYLYSIFYNLISNSIKYRQPGLDCSIKITSALQPGRMEIHFQDNGLGIDLDKKREQLFGSYKRFHLHVEGKGLGLFMVKTQVETLGGTINVESKVNTGTEITISFNV